LVDLIRIIAGTSKWIKNLGGSAKVRSFGKLTGGLTAISVMAMRETRMYRRRSYRRHRLRARQTVVWFLAVALFSQFAFALALEISAPKIRDPEYGRKLAHLHEQIAADPERPRILAIGSSRTLNGLRPERLSSAEFAVFNFGLTAHGPVRQAAAFDRLLRDGVRPTAVTIEVRSKWIWRPPSRIPGETSNF
jgi:hypothetical protein